MSTVPNSADQSVCASGDDLIRHGTFPGGPIRRGPRDRRARGRASGWQGRRESNSQPLVLETSALPIELHPSVVNDECRMTNVPIDDFIRQDRIFVTTPEPTVRPPSRMANRTPSSIAIGVISSTLKRALSPGMHISASPIKLAEPVTSVVRK